MSTGRTLPAGVDPPALLQSLKITGRVRPLQVIHRSQALLHDLGITPKHTRPYRPQTNGKIERFHRTLADRWAYARHYTGESQRRDALPNWLHEYNHHRPHTAIGRRPPISRLTNVCGQYS